MSWALQHELLVWSSKYSSTFPPSQGVSLKTIVSPAWHPLHSAVCRRWPNFFFKSCPLEKVGIYFMGKFFFPFFIWFSCEFFQEFVHQQLLGIFNYTVFNLNVFLIETIFLVYLRDLSELSSIQNLWIFYITYVVLVCRTNLNWCGHVCTLIHLFFTYFWVRLNKFLVSIDFI